MAAPPILTELRLTSFKSFRDAKLKVPPLLLITGRNSSGKSNVFDAVSVLARISGGGPLAKVLDDSTSPDGAIRGGSRGCAPHGKESFSLGCNVSVGATVYSWDIEVEVGDRLAVLDETLESQTSGKTKNLIGAPRALPDDDAPAIGRAVANGKKGSNPITSFWRDRAVLGQVESVPEADDDVRAGVAAIRSALGSMYQLDPIPTRMRAFVPRTDYKLRRHADNFSATLRRLQDRQPEDFGRVQDLVKLIVDERVHGLAFSDTSLGDVMVGLREVLGPLSAGVEQFTPAREMSDGLLRVLGVALSLLADAELLEAGVPGKPNSAVPAVFVEEIENGLHPSQASLLLSLLVDAVRSSSRQVVATTHSPALLDAAEGVLNESIIVCYRDAQTGLSQLVPMVDLPQYPKDMARGSIGDNVTAGRLTGPARAVQDSHAFDDIFGIA